MKGRSLKIKYLPQRPIDKQCPSGPPFASKQVLRINFQMLLDQGLTHKQVFPCVYTANAQTDKQTEVYVYMRAHMLKY